MPDQSQFDFRAGICDFDESKSPPRVTPRDTPGTLHLRPDDDLVHFCWYIGTEAKGTPELELSIPVADATFTPYNAKDGEQANHSRKPVNGRIFVLKFSSSSSRYLFWLQSRSQHPANSPNWFSLRDLGTGEIVNRVLQGEQFNLSQAIANLPSGSADDDDDETMEDVEGEGDPNEHHRSGSGGAGPDATGGDVREEGQGAREGGADGGRASDSMDANSIIQNFIRSMPTVAGQSSPQERLFTTLTDLLTSSTTIPWLDAAAEDTVDQLLQFLPVELVTMAQETDDDAGIDTEQMSREASKQALSLAQKKDILRRVLRSPQFSQSLASLTVALRDGGLPSISEALQIPVRNNGYMRRGGVPLGGGEAVEAFIEGVKNGARTQSPEGGNQMDTQ